MRFGAKPWSRFGGVETDLCCFCFTVDFPNHMSSFFGKGGGEIGHVARAETMDLSQNSGSKGKNSVLVHNALSTQQKGLQNITLSQMPKWGCP